MSLDSVIGVLAPNICIGCGADGHVLCSKCLETAGDPIPSRCAGCKKLTDDYKTCSSCRSWLDTYAIYVATEYVGVYEQLIHELKFESKRQATVPIAKIMAEVMPKLDEKTIICPVPTATSRIRQRGFDHAKLISKELVKILNALDYSNNWVSQRLLIRKSNARQVGSSRNTRIKQMNQEFELSSTADLKGRTVLLVDDVVTTGATLAGASKTLKEAGAKRVYALVFAQKP